MSRRSRTQRLVTLAASTALAAGGVLVPTSAFAAPPTPHAGTVKIVTAAHGSLGHQATALPTVEWVDTTDSASGITVRLPGKATFEKLPETADTLPSRFYSVDTTDGYSAFTIADLPKDAQIDLDMGLQSFIERYGKETGETLNSSSIQKTSVDGRPTLDARLATKNSGKVGSIRLIDAGTHIVQLQTFGYAADEKAVNQTHQQMLTSVRLP
jgi:hypothetical protein